jgi:hypothetical protein
MKLIYAYSKLKFNGYQTLIVVRAIPSWFEKFFLRRKVQIIKYVGHGTTWTERDLANNNILVKRKEVIKRLQSIEAGVQLDFDQHAKKGKTLPSRGIR